MSKPKKNTLMVNCNEAMRKKSQDKSSMRAGEKKNIKKVF